MAFTYREPFDINHPLHKIGQDVEQYVTAKYGVKPSPQGTLRVVFVHCEGSRCFVDQVTRSKTNPDEVRLALGFLCDFITVTKAVYAIRLCNKFYNKSCNFAREGKEWYRTEKSMHFSCKLFRDALCCQKDL